MKAQLVACLVFVSLVVPFGCASKTQKCMERTNENYDEAIAACKDDACKEAAEKDKAGWYEACKELD